MDQRPEAKQSAVVRRPGRRVAIVCGLLVLASAGSSNSGARLSADAQSSLSRLAAHGDTFLKAPSERSGAWADGAIDSFEEDDLDCEQLVPTPCERAATAARHDFRIPFSASADLARPHPARGPPSA